MKTLVIALIGVLGLSHPTQVEAQVRPIPDAAHPLTRELINIGSIEPSQPQAIGRGFYAVGTTSKGEACVVQMGSLFLINSANSPYPGMVDFNFGGRLGTSWACTKTGCASTSDAPSNMSSPIAFDYAEFAGQVRSGNGVTMDSQLGGYTIELDQKNDLVKIYFLEQSQTEETKVSMVLHLGVPSSVSVENSSSGKSLTCQNLKEQVLK